ncbi:hypothetical protein [Pleomorphomonas koreensis]|uniref:hypothetical protein n=1 Tax=Pleomorphomonas koreensis TaxID=257440 RepID=UPI000425767C|nr:hypothetical protein [Pleomorphomonas koreensis]
MTTALSALTFLRANWRLVLAGIAAVILLLAVWAIFDAGRDSERAKQDRASMTNLRDRSAIDDAVRTDDDVALCLRLGGDGDCRGLRVGR